MPETKSLRSSDYTTSTKMRAIVYDRYGGPDVLHIAERKVPRRLPGQVVIRVSAAGVNPIDYRLRSGQMKWLLPFGFPRVPGYDVAGVIADCADDSRFAVGDRVLAFLNHVTGGGCADFANCAISSVAKIPDSMSFETAAAIPLAGCTALQSLRDHGKMQSGDRVLINGASGGVGGFAIQIAKAYGGLVDAVASGANEGYCMSLGADSFLDYKREDFTQSDRRWDLVFDVAGKSSFRAARRVLKPNGRFVSTEPSLQGMLTTVLTWPRSQSGRIMLAKSRGKDLRELIELHEQGKLQVTIDQRFPMQDAAEAHRRIESGVEHGKIVLVNEPDIEP